jgi:hypothetical protein
MRSVTDHSRARPRRKLGPIAYFCVAAGTCLGIPLALAQGLPTPGEAIGRIFDAVKLRNELPQPPDFVTNSRTQDLEYQPLRQTDRANHRKSPQELQSLDAEMAGAAARNREAAQHAGTPDVPALPGSQKKTPAKTKR